MSKSYLQGIVVGLGVGIAIRTAHGVHRQRFLGFGTIGAIEMFLHHPDLQFCAHFAHWYLFR